MANEEQVRILKKGVDAWNLWRLTNHRVKRNRRVNINLDGADLRGCNLTNVNLLYADLRGANLTNVNLFYAELRSSNLRGANLRGANLTNASLSAADLRGANLNAANLRGANLTNASLTGACIEDWNINTETHFEGVICDYIYLKEGQQERRPADPNRNFEPGEFAKLVEKYIEAVDLIFKDGIDWKAFLTAFQELQIESESGELSIQAIEKKRDGAFVIRVDAPADANKETIEASFWSKYQPLLEAKDREIKLLSQQTELYSEQIEVIRQDNTRLIGIVETMAEKETSKVNMTFNAPVSGVAGNVEGNQIIYASEQKQTLAKAAAEIQSLLKQLEQTNPTATEAEKIAYVNDETSPGFKRRLVGALQAGGEAAIEEFLDNPYVNVGKAVVKGWIKPE